MYIFEIHTFLILQKLYDLSDKFETAYIFALIRSYTKLFKGTIWAPFNV